MATLQTKHMIFLPIGQMSTSSWQHYKPSMWFFCQSTKWVHHHGNITYQTYDFCVNWPNHHGNITNQA
jgi:hypothetical protein